MSITLTDDETIALFKFLLTCGYISEETHPEVHHIYRKLYKLIEEPRRLKAKNRLLPLEEEK